jgi:hypothetical protein
MENIIEEMALIMCGREGCKTCTHFIDATKCAAVVSAKKLYNAGYRKQKEGEWVEEVRFAREGKVLLLHYKCNLCGVYLATQANFCPNCGAKMKGADNEN